MRDKNLNILIAGTGGQGVLLASNITAAACMNAGHDVKMSVARGMSKRGGSVCGHIRVGRKVYSPLISNPEADILIGLAPSETKRWKTHLKKRGILIELGARGLRHRRKKRTLTIAYEDICGQLEDDKSVNVFLLGVASNLLCKDKRHWIKAIKESSPSRSARNNISAFEKGQRSSEGQYP